MEECPKCKKLVELDELVRHVSTFDGRTHICLSCAIKEGQPGKVKSHRKTTNSKVYFHRKRRR